MSCVPAHSGDGDSGGPLTTQPSLEAQAFLRSAYGLLLILTLLQALPQARRFFLSERWDGYGERRLYVEAVHNPYVLPIVLAAWLAAAVSLLLGVIPAVAALLNLVLCRYFFVGMRWKGLLRGMGAPGFMTYWLGACVFFLEWGVAHDPSGNVRAAALLAFRVDFAVIMLCAGTYKFVAGYRKNQGMQFGLVNPWWGYWGRWYRRFPPEHPLFRGMNHFAWGTEVVAGILMLVPATQLPGAALIFVSFVFIATQIRLGFLCEMVMLCCVIYVHAGDPIDAVLSRLPVALTSAGVPIPEPVNLVMTFALITYAVVLPFVKIGQYVNLLLRRPLPQPLQRALDRYANLFGIIVWRVFSIDHTNFYARIMAEDPLTGERRPLARPGRVDTLTSTRFVHVGEFITLVSIFTTAKYFPSRPELLERRLIRYTRTLPYRAGSRVIFEYVVIANAGRFEDRTVAEFVVDPDEGCVTERVLDPDVSIRAPSPVSPVHEAAHPGTYQPVHRTSA